MLLLFLIVYVLAHIAPPVALAVSILAFVAGFWAVHPILLILIFLFLA